MPLKPLASTLAALTAIAIAHADARAAEKITLSVPAVHAAFAYVNIAIEKGYFKDEDLDVELKLVGGGTATPALMGGSLDYSSSPSSAMSAILKGAPLTIVLVGQSRPIYKLYSFDPAVRTLADLKGKAIAINSRGGTDEIAMRMLLKEKGLPMDYVGYTAIGTGATRTAAITSGAQKYAMVQRIEMESLKESGVLAKGHMIVDIAKDVEMQTGGLVTTAKEIASNPDRVKRVLRALWKGTIYLQRERDGTLEIMQRLVPKLSRDGHVRDLEGALEDLDEDGVLPLEAARKELAVRSEIVGLASDKIPPVEKVYDFSMIRAVIAELNTANWQPAR
jgi:ABC-type nitrate/sulfonate/bicarbonate transport system substrate-binding protein